MILNEITVESYAKINHIKITINGKPGLYQVRGLNGNGKSSVLSAIAYVLTGKQVAEPVNKKAVEAKVTCDFGDVVISRKINNEGKQTLSAVKADGSKLSATDVKTLWNPNSFDLSEFYTAKPQEQVSILKNIVGIGSVIDELDNQYKIAYDTRTVINRDVALAKAAVDNILLPDNCPTDEISISDIGKQITDASLHNQQNELLRNKLVKSRESYKNKKKEYDELSKRLEFIKSEMESMESEGKILHEQVSKLQDYDLTALNQNYSNVDENNRLARIYQEKQKAIAKYESVSKESENLTNELQSIKEQKNQVMAQVKFPIPELGFGDGIVTYKGLPLSSASDGERLKIAVGIAMANCKDVKLIMIKDGSLLDENNLKIIEDMAIEKGFQVLVEVVSSHNVEGGFFVEDGVLIE